MSKGKLFIISGASGVGKSTVLSRVMAARDDLRFSVSATTRAPRPGEVDGTSYYFGSSGYCTLRESIRYAGIQRKYLY